MAERAANLRRANRDDLGLGRALGDRVLPLLVGAMTFLAALAGAGAVGARALAGHWQTGAAASVTVQVPRPDEAVSGQILSQGGGQSAGQIAGQTRLQRVLDLLRRDPDVVNARALNSAEMGKLLQPWFGGAGPPPGLDLPGVIAVRLDTGVDAVSGLAARLQRDVPGTLTESHTIWVSRLATLVSRLQACAWLALGVVAGVAALVVAVATRSGLLARHEAIRIVHGLGASDSYIANRFAGRATALAAYGAAIGACAALPVLLGLAVLAAPFSQRGEAMPDAPTLAPGGLLAMLEVLPAELWLALPALPAAAALIGFVTARGTVRQWLRRLP